MTTADRLRVLLADLAADRAAAERHVAAVHRCLSSVPWEVDAPVLSVVAVALHHWYGAVESSLERIARCFEGLPERDDRWHQRLLEVATRTIVDVRPAVVTEEETAEGLRDLLAFRHFFRHAYAVSLSPAKLAANAELPAKTHPRLAADLGRFEAAVQRAIDGDARQDPPRRGGS